MRTSRASRLAIRPPARRTASSKRSTSPGVRCSRLLTFELGKRRGGVLRRLSLRTSGSRRFAHFGAWGSNTICDISSALAKLRGSIMPKRSILGNVSRSRWIAGLIAVQIHCATSVLCGLCQNCVSFCSMADTSTNLRRTGIFFACFGQGISHNTLCRSLNSTSDDSARCSVEPVTVFCKS